MKVKAADICICTPGDKFPPPNNNTPLDQVEGHSFLVLKRFSIIIHGQFIMRSTLVNNSKYIYIYMCVCICQHRPVREWFSGVCKRARQLLSGRYTVCNQAKAVTNPLPALCLNRFINFHGTSSVCILAAHGLLGRWTDGAGPRFVCNLCPKQSFSCATVLCLEAC